MDVYERRRARLALMVEKLSNGNIAAFAREHGYSRAQISQYLSETYNNGRSIGERAAREIEKKSETLPGWLDQPVAEEESEMFAEPYSTAELRVVTNRTLPQDSAPETSYPYLYHVPIVGEIDPYTDDKVEVKIAQSLPAKYLSIYVESSEVYALQVSNAGLLPRFKEGEYLALRKKGPYKAGDDILVKFEGGMHAIMRFLYARNGEVALGSVFDQAPPEVYTEDEIESIEVIVAIIHSKTRIIEE